MSALVQPFVPTHNESPEIIKLARSLYLDSQPESFFVDGLKGLGKQATS